MTKMPPLAQAQEKTKVGRETMNYLFLEDFRKGILKSANLGHNTAYIYQDPNQYKEYMGLKQETINNLLLELKQLGYKLEPAEQDNVVKVSW